MVVGLSLPVANGDGGCSVLGADPGTFRPTRHLQLNIRMQAVGTRSGLSSSAREKDGGPSAAGVGHVPRSRG